MTRLIKNELNRIYTCKINCNIYTHIHLEDVIEELEGVGCV